MSWLRLKPPRGMHSTSILDVSKVFYHHDMLWMGIWVHRHCYACAGWGWIFGDNGVDLSPSDVVMTWLKLQTHMDCCPHPYWINTMCFTILICYEWVYWSTLTLLCLCRLGVDIRGYWGSLSLSDVVMSWLRLKPPVECIPHPYWM